MKETFGLMNAKNAKPPNPKPSPKGFEWPNQSDHDDKVAQKIAASLQELLPQRGWKHIDLAREMFGTKGANGAPKNTASTRRWVVAEHPIPSEEHAGYIAELLGISMARLLEPEGKFESHPPMIRGRSDSKRFKLKKDENKTPSGRDREKQRAYNAKYRARRAAGKEKRPYVRKHTNGAEVDPNLWVLGDGVPIPVYTMVSHAEIANHVKLTIDVVIPQPRAMAIIHMLEHQKAEEE